MSKQVQACRFTLTLNLPKGKCFKDFNLLDFGARLGVSYIIGQGELAPTTGQKHFQAYVEFAKKKTFTAVVARCAAVAGFHVHVIKSKGSATENKDYCTKEETRAPFPEAAAVEAGEPMAQGSRTDIADLFKLIREQGATELEIAELAPSTYAQYGRSLERYRSLVAPKRTWPTKLIVLWGPSGHGKTAQAYTLDPERIRYGGGRFFVGYTGTNPVVLLDEFDPACMSREQFSEMCDRYATSFEIKGGAINWNPKVIIFTSNSDPATWYCDKSGEQHEAIKRRFAEFGTITYFGEKVAYTQRTLASLWSKPTTRATPLGGTKTTSPTSSVGLSGSKRKGPADDGAFTESSSEEEVEDYGPRRSAPASPKPPAPASPKPSGEWAPETDPAHRAWEEAAMRAAEAVRAKGPKGKEPAWWTRPPATEEASLLSAWKGKGKKPFHKKAKGL